MQIQIIPIRESLSLYEQRQTVLESDFLNFTEQLQYLVNQVNNSQSEEYHKNLVTDFLKNTQFQSFHINTNQTQDLVIRAGKDKNDAVQVLIEFKKPDTKNAEMLQLSQIAAHKINVKSLHQLILYYLRERIEHNNHAIKHLIITNLYEWYIFDENDFDKIFYQNSQLKKQYINDYKSANKNTDYFYDFIAKPFIENQVAVLPCVHIDTRNIDYNNEKNLVLLHKIFSPKYLLKLPNEYDSNTLNYKFYNELLYILGLEEVEQNGKKVIVRVNEKYRQTGSILENTIQILQRNAKLQNLKNLDNYGKNTEEQYFGIALELCITWLNRILFLKLLEAQLLQIHRLETDSQKNYAFLHLEKIKDFDELDELFFDVLAVEEDERKELIKRKFPTIPYLNSSLFEVSELEQWTLQISNLKNHLTLPVYKTSVLKEQTQVNSQTTLNTLQYLFEFLAAYDFGAENTEFLVRKTNKSLINSAVLGLIFEKINGYKDGSFFTPAYITMYMCRETLRDAVLQKFNVIKGYDCKKFEDLRNFIDYRTPSERKEANEIINSLRICDPSVGSGHFLVSALNELIVIKSELNILEDSAGVWLRGVKIRVEQDELQITDSETGEFFSYRVAKNGALIDEKQQIQATLFQEKKILIENCLFGVDINENAAKISRLRLWIELLKNAYYVKKHKLQTLPNIDINVKCGNSLVSRFVVNDKNILLPKDRLQVKQLIEKYKALVINYKNNLSSVDKQLIRKQIASLKEEFENFSSPNDLDYIALRNKSAELGQNILDFDNQTYQRRKNLQEEIISLKNQYEKKQKTIYGKSFEWRFEFPEILNEEGEFVGFDVLLGNPPYIVVKGGRYTGAELDKEIIDYLKANFKTAEQQINTYTLFVELSYTLLNPSGASCVIIPNTFLANEYSLELRKFLVDNFHIRELYNVGMVFPEASVETLIIAYSKTQKQQTLVKHKNIEHFIKLNEVVTYTEDKKFLILLDEQKANIIKKLNQNPKLNSLAKVWRGLTTGNDTKFIQQNPLDATYKPLITGSEIERYGALKPKKFVAYLPEELDRARDERIFLLKEKLISKFVGTKLCFTYDTKQFYVLNSACITEVLDNTISLKYLLALLNSTLLNFYFSHVFTDYRDTFPIMKSGNLENLPIKIADKHTQITLENLVDKILLAKQNNQKTTALEVEKEIDRLVYELYEISATEINLIESK